MNLTKKWLRTVLISSVLTMLCVVAASAAENVGVGTVTADALRLRSEASAEGEIVATATQDELVLVLEEVDESWYKVDYKSIEGYMSREFLDVSATVEADLGYGRVNTNGFTLNVRSGPGSEYSQVGSLAYGKVVSLTGMDNGWYQIVSGNVSGYVSSEYIVSCKDTSGARGDSDVTTPLGQQIVDLALQYLGRPYVWGGNGPNGFDCSGFTRYVYASFGCSLNRTASSQLHNGVSVSRGELQPGDLVFFDNGQVSTPVSHVGIYIGGDRFVHASTHSYTVEISSLSGYYANIYKCARRVL